MQIAGGGIACERLSVLSQRFRCGWCHSESPSRRSPTSQCAVARGSSSAAVVSGTSRARTAFIGTGKLWAVTAAVHLAFVANTHPNTI